MSSVVRIPDEILPPDRGSRSRAAPSARRRPSRRRLRRRRRLAALAVTCVFVGAWLGAVTWWDDGDLPIPVPLARPRLAPVRPVAVGERRVYPYSVVPGGVRDTTELARAMAADPVVAAHYEGVDVSRLRLATVTVPRSVHVSYRRGDRVYWTRRKVLLRHGEAVLTDGVREARTRCANQIADTPLGETSMDEPPIEVLDEPLPMTPPQNGGFVPLRGHDLFIQASQLPALTQVGFADAPDLLGPYAVVLPPPTWIMGPGGPSAPWTVTVDSDLTADPESVDPGTPDPAPVPEPGTLTLLGAGGAALLARHLKRKRRTA